MLLGGFYNTAPLDSALSNSGLLPRLHLSSFRDSLDRSLRVRAARVEEAAAVEPAKPLFVFLVVWSAVCDD